MSSDSDTDDENFIKKARKTNLNFKECRKLANSIDSLSSTNILNNSIFNLNQWPAQNCTRNQSQDFQDRMRNCLIANLKRNSALSKKRGATKHDKYMWSQLCAIGTENRNKCDSWLDVCRYYKPITVTLYRKKEENNEKSRYQRLLVQMGQLSEDVICTCGKHKLIYIYYTQSNIGRQLLVGSTCILKEWFNPVLHYCYNKNWYSRDKLENIYDCITLAKTKAIDYLNNIIYLLNQEPYTKDVAYLLQQCYMCEKFIAFHIKKRKEREKKKKNIENDFEVEMMDSINIKNILQRINDIRNIGNWKKDRKNKLINKLKEACYNDVIGDIESIIPPTYLKNWHHNTAQNQLKKLYNNEVLIKYYTQNENTFDKIFDDKQNKKIINLVNKYNDELDFKTEKENVRERKKEIKKEKKEKKRKEKIERYKKLLSYYKAHINPNKCKIAYYPLVKYSNKTKLKKKLHILWKKDPQWLYDYVEDNDFEFGDKWQEIKYDWVQRAMAMRKILDDAENNILDIKKVDEVIKSCDEDKSFHPNGWYYSKRRY